jgi:hypothetical protein
MSSRSRVNSLPNDDAGANLNHEHPQRLKGILEETDPQGRIEVKQWLMFAEDFLGLVTRERLVR